MAVVDSGHVRPYRSNIRRILSSRFSIEMKTNDRADESAAPKIGRRKFLAASAAGAAGIASPAIFPDIASADQGDTAESSTIDEVPSERV